MEFILQAGVDKIVVMHQGKLLMEGTPQQVKNSTEVKEAYLGDDDGEEE
jgi:ABC-type branched-subunit amino acid transport system ATPase component